jgi:hypothetical protein
VIGALVFINADATPKNTTINCCEVSVPKIMAWYGSYFAGDRYTVAFNGRNVPMDQNGGNPSLRIAISGYDGEHNELTDIGWRVVEWKANGGFSNQSNKRGRDNAKLERIWFSPHCIDTTKQGILI